MDQLVHFHFKNALTPATKKTYRSGQRRYINYCDKAHCQPLPLTEQRLCQFVTKLAEEGLSHQTIQSYLTGTRQLQLAANLPEPHIGSMPKLEQVLKGIKVVKSRSVAQARTRLPITPDILQRMRRVLDQQPHAFNHIMLWAASCLCFYGFLRCGEITVPSAIGYDPGSHLSLGDVAEDNIESLKS